MVHILSGDIGATKTHLVLYQDGKRIEEKKYSSSKYGHLSEIVAEFLSSHPVGIEGACLGVPGPVRAGKCRTTNLPWELDEKILAEQFKIPHFSLINDLEAYGYGLPCLSPQDFAVLNEGLPTETGHRALIAAGTGLGEGGLCWDGKTYFSIATEGGQCDFAPSDDLEIDLFRYLKNKFSHVSYERILSGPGFENLFYFFIEFKKENKPLWYTENEKIDLPKAITQRALTKECPLCVKILELFLSIYGAEAGNLALKFLAMGGVYMGGGIALKILPALKESLFMNRFINKGRFASLLSQIPVKVILNESCAVLGAAEFARRKMNS